VPEVLREPSNELLDGRGLIPLGLEG
jgi:hypothetical protein